MRRRDFLKMAAGAAILRPDASRYVMARSQTKPGDHAQCGPGYASPAEAMRGPREKLLYVVALYTGTDVHRPDYLATVDVDPTSPTYSRVIHRTEMPNTGDELHHFGWNACSSCHGDPTKTRRYLLVPGFKSGRIHVIDTIDPSRPKLAKVIESEQIKEKTGLTAPHTTHCLADGRVLISMLGDKNGNGPGGYLLLNDDLDIEGRWETSMQGVLFGYDNWYQPRHNVMVSSGWASPQTYWNGFEVKDVEAGKYGSRLYFWDWKERKLIKSVDLGPDGKIPLEVRFHHNPESTHGFVGAALSSAIWHWQKKAGDWQVEKVIQVEPVAVEGKPSPVPGLITDILISMDDRFLYLSNWLHGDVRQYDIRNPSQPKMTGQVWCGGLIGKKASYKDRSAAGGAQMLQLSLDGKRLYVTDSLLSRWDNQFYPDLAKKGSCLIQLDCDTDRGGMKLNEAFLVDFGKEPAGPARAHEMRYPGGDCSSEIFA